MINIPFGPTYEEMLHPEKLDKDLRERALKGKENELNPFTISLYPNPVKGNVLNISGFEGEGSYRIFSTMGQELANGKVENNTINVGDLATGTYMIEVTTTNGSNMKRFIKQ